MAIIILHKAVVNMIFVRNVEIISDSGSGILVFVLVGVKKDRRRRGSPISKHNSVSAKRQTRNGPVYSFVSIESPKTKYLW